MKHSVLSIALTGILAGTTLTIDATAATFSDRASFDAAVTNMTTLDFEGVIGTTGFDANYPHGTGHMAPTITLAGVQFSNAVSSDSWDDIYILANDGAGASGSLNGTTAIWLGRDSSRITLPAGMTAFGTNYGVPIDGPGGLPLGETSSINATFHYRNGVDPETFTLSVTGKSQFFGLTGAEIDYIDLAYAPNQYMVFDNLSIAQAVPEPETYALMLVGLSLLGFSVRRKKA